MLCLIFGIADLAFGQRLWEKMNVPIDFHQLQYNIPENEVFHVYLKGAEDALKKTSKEHGRIYKRYTGQYAAVAIPKAELIELEEIDEVKAVHFQLCLGRTLLNESRVHTSLDRVLVGLAGLPSELKGEGVIIGIIDAGLDLNHPDFLDENGDTRVLNLWDQTLPINEISRIPVYGQLYHSADINDGLCPHEDQAVYYGHGANTTGIATANGDFDEQYAGCAPEADIIVVSSNFFSYSWTSLVADAVHYIFTRVEEHGRPCVINGSIGNYFGSHDGDDIPTKEIEALIAEESGRIMVCAACNLGENVPDHLGYNADSDTNFTWFQIPSSATSGNGLIQFSMFGDTGDFESLNFSIAADRVSPSLKFEGRVPFDSIASCLNTSVSENLISVSGNYLGQVTYWCQEFNGTYQVYMLKIVGTSAERFVKIIKS
jgi:subtilisin family serine protease